MMASDDGGQVARVRVERGVYRQPNGKYAVCFMLDGKLRFRTVDGSLDDARSERARLAIAAQAGMVPRLSAADVLDGRTRWLERFEAMVAVGERRERTLESHRYHLDRHLLPLLGRRQIAAITVDDVADLISSLSARGRPRPDPRPQRALGQDEIVRLLEACAPRYRLMIVTALYTGTAHLRAACADLD